MCSYFKCANLTKPDSEMTCEVHICDSLKKVSAIVILSTRPPAVFVLQVSNAHLESVMVVGMFQAAIQTFYSH